MRLDAGVRREVRRLASRAADDICERVESGMGVELPDEKFVGITSVVEDDIVEAVVEAWANA